MKEVVKQLRQLRSAEGLINPDQTWAKQNRERLLTQIGNTVAAPSEPTLRERTREFVFMFRSARIIRLFRPTLTAFLVALVATGGWIASVSASFNSVPGARLWAVKRAAQKTEVAVKSIGASEGEKAELHLKLAKSRADDIKKAVVEKLPTSAASTAADTAKTVKDVAAAARDLAQAVQSASVATSEQVKTVAKANPQEAVALVKDVTQNTGEIVKTLKQTAVESGTTAPAVTRQMIETVESVNNSAISTMETVVGESKAVTGTEGAAVRQIISGKLTEMAETAKDMKQNVDTVKEVIADAGALKPSAATSTMGVKTDVKNASTTPAGGYSLKPEIMPVSTTSGMPYATSTAVQSPSASTTAILISKVKEAEQKTAVIEESVGEIQKIIDDGNLREALSKLKGLNESAGTAEKFIIETRTQANMTAETRLPAPDPGLK